MKNGDRHNDRSASRRLRSRSPVERRGPAGPAGDRAARRVYVANIPFDVKWSELKDYFREKIGNVTYCQMFENEDGKSRGAGLVEFSDVPTAKRAIAEMHRSQYKGRELVVKEDLDCERDRCGRLVLNSSGGSSGNMGPRPSSMEPERVRPTQGPYDWSQFNTFGLAPQFLNSLGIQPPLNNRVFIANLEYKVGEKKLEEIYRLAGKIIRVKLYTDAKGESKGHGTVEYEHPVESVQAISMFNEQKLYGRPMSVRMDRYETEEMPETLPTKLPNGLEGIGKGLGIGGQPLNVSKSMLAASYNSVNIPSSNPASQSNLGQAQVTPMGVQQPVNQMAAQQVPPQLSNPNSLAVNNMSQYGQQQQQQQQQVAPLSAGGMGGGGLNLGSLGSTFASNLSSAVNPNNNVGVGVGVGMGLNQGMGNANPNMMANAASYSSSLAAGQMGGQGGQSAGGPGQGSMGGGGGGQMYSSYDTQGYQRQGPAQNDQKFLAPSGTDTISVRGLPPNMSWQAVKERFSEIGEVRFAEFKSRGHAVVRFVYDRDAQRAVDLMHGVRVDNRPIEVSLTYF